MVEHGGGRGVVGQLELGRQWAWGSVDGGRRLGRKLESRKREQGSRGHWGRRGRRRRWKERCLGLGLGRLAVQGRRATLEADGVVHAAVVIPPFTTIRQCVPDHEPHPLLVQRPLKVFQLDLECKPVPFARQARSQVASVVSVSRMGGEGRWERWERSLEVAADLGSRLPVIQSKPDSNDLGKGNVADKDGPAKGWRTRRREAERFQVNVGWGLRSEGIGHSAKR